MKKINLNVFIGAFLLLIGIISALKVLNIHIPIDNGILLWGFVSIFGVAMLLKDSKVTVLPLIFIIVGLWNVLEEIDVITGSIFSLIWPIIIIMVGLNFIFVKGKTNKEIIDIEKSDSSLAYNGIFSGVEQRLSFKDFKGLTANAIFGGVELDLRDVEILDNVQIDAVALFGGITLILPDKYNVVVNESLALFGGIENKFKGIHDDNKKTICINSRAFFGGVEFK